jgi:hypothetical protein
MMEDLQNNYKEKSILVEGAVILPEFIKNLDINK